MHNLHLQARLCSTQQLPAIRQAQCTVRALGLVGLVTAAGLLTAGTASAATPMGGRSPANLVPVCRANLPSSAVPATWIPQSAAERDRRLRWDQVSRWDRDRNGRLSPAEVRSFRAAAVRVPGGPDCGRPENPPRRG